MTTVIKEETLAKGVHVGDQYLTYHELFKIDGKNFEIKICSDSFKKQCYARLYVCNDLKWNVLYEIPYSEMETKSELYYHIQYRENPLTSEGEFEKDVKTLKGILNKLL